MERLEYEFTSTRSAARRNFPTLSGVLGSGNLEILVESRELCGKCAIEVETAATGFGAIWKAVLSDVIARWPVGDIKISINDAGATPAVVALRLDQALKTYLGRDEGASI